MVHAFVPKSFSMGLSVRYQRNVLCVGASPPSDIRKGADEAAPLHEHVRANAKLEAVNVNTNTAQVFF